MSSGKLVSRVVVGTFALTKQRSVDNFKRAPLFASIVYGEDLRAPRVGQGREQRHGDQGTRGVYEMDQETYQMRKVG